MSLSAFGMAALEYARQGMAVFPLIPKSKKPLTANGFHDATTNAQQIEQWWQANPTANIGGVPASCGLIALDVDSPSCWSLAQSLGLLSEPTHRVTTGLSQPGAETVHLYFRHPAPEKDTQIGGTIIVRGSRGYVVLPPSIHPVTGMAYVTDTTLADAVALPDRAAIALMAQQSTAAIAAHTTQVLQAETVTAGGRHAALVTTAGKLAAHGMSDGDALAMLHGYNLRVCSPPKSSQEVDDIWQYVIEREASKRAEVAARRALVDLTGFLATPARPATPSRTLIRVSELMQGPATIPYLVDHLLPEDGLGVLWAAAGVGKTFTALDLALHVATGKAWQGRAVKQCAVLYAVGEGFQGMRARVWAWCVEHQIQPDQLEDSFNTRRVSWDITSQAARYDVALELSELAVTPRLVVIDTLSSNAPSGFDDNSTKDMKALMDAARTLRDTGPATVLFTHHTGHETSRMRGSTDAIGAVDVSLHLKITSGKGRELVVAKARDFEAPPPIPLQLVPIHGAQVVRGGESVDLSALQAPPSLTDILRTLADAGRPLKTTEWQRESGKAGSQFYALRKQAVEQHLVMETPAGTVLSDAGLLTIESTKPKLLHYSTPTP